MSLQIEFAGTGTDVAVAPLRSPQTRDEDAATWQLTFTLRPIAGWPLSPAAGGSRWTAAATLPGSFARWTTESAYRPGAAKPCARTEQETGSSIVAGTPVFSYPARPDPGETLLTVSLVPVLPPNRCGTLRFVAPGDAADWRKLQRLRQEVSLSALESGPRVEEWRYRVSGTFRDAGGSERISWRGFIRIRVVG